MISNAVLENALDLQHRFQQARPFRHVAIDSFLDDAACEALLRDFPAFDQRKALNEMGEVGGKAVVEGVASISPFYRSFYRYINSKPFLDAISEITGIPDLIADETLFGGGTHENIDGQSLDTHVDFNIDERRLLHRRINLLVYLNKDWQESWGGVLELHSDPWNSAYDRIERFLPIFNRAVIFETGEYSWHGFPKINLPPERKATSRKSFSIYLYTKTRPLEDVVAPHGTFYVPDPAPEVIAGAALTEAQADQLRRAIASREGLLRMYQKLLVEKEQRLHDLMWMGNESMKSGALDYRVVLSSRSWRMVMALQRLKHRVMRAWRGAGT